MLCVDSNSPQQKAVMEQASKQRGLEWEEKDQLKLSKRKGKGIQKVIHEEDILKINFLFLWSVFPGNVLEWCA